jgi:hypothetical protein
MVLDLTDPTFLGLLGIAVAIFVGMVAIAIPFWIQTRRQGVLNKRLHEIALLMIDEKIAILTQQAGDISEWKAELVRMGIGRIVGDISAIHRVKDMIDRDQTTKFRRVLADINSEMNKRKFDPSDINQAVDPEFR